MKSILSIFATLVLGLCLPSFAQSGTNSTQDTNNTNQPSSTAGTNNNNSGSQSGMSNGQSSANQNNMNNGSSMSQNHNGREHSMEGCIVREDTYYYLQPERGERVRLSQNDDVAKNEGHQVRVHGQMSKNSENEHEGAQNSNSAMSSQNGENGTQNAKGMKPQKEIMVDKLEFISSTCQPTNNSQGNQH